MNLKYASELLICSSAITLCCISVSRADTTVNGDRSAPLSTSSAGDVTIAADATLDVTGSDPLTLDDNSTITIEEDGAVHADDADARNGINVAAGTNGSIVIDGVLRVEEDFVPDDDDGDGKPDGPIAQASDRTGISVNSSSGSITNEGVIYVEGLNSAGIRFQDGWSGEFDNTGSITVVGDGSVGIVTGDVATDFSVGGSVSSVGANSQVLLIDGDVSGRVIIDGSLTKRNSYTNDDGGTYTLSRSQLRAVAPAVEVTGSVANGILIDAPPINTDDDNDDEDGDGIDDSEETTGSITSYGESPALLIGGADDIVIGGGQTRDGTYSLGVDGTINAYGSYSTFDATAVVIGGEGGSVDLSSGISVGGTIRATTPDASALALLINDGANVPDLYVSGQISAVISSTGEGSAIAVRDLSGTLSQIDNTGAIIVSGAAEDETIALDLSNNTTGVTILQYLNEIDAEAYAEELEDEDYDPDSPTIYARITGDILTGSGNDLIEASTGTIRGDVWLGDGDDQMILSGNADFAGDLYAEAGDFSLSMSDSARFDGLVDVAGGQATLFIADNAIFSGTTANSAQMSATVTGGLLQVADGESMVLDTLDVSSGGRIGVILDGDSQTSSNFVVNTATFATGSGLDVEIDDILGAEGTYTVLTANTLTGASELTLDAGELPLLYSASLATDATTIAVSVERRTAEELGLTKPQTAAFDAMLATAATNSYLERSLLQAEDIGELQHQIDQLLPDYNGGIFDFVARSSALSARRITDTVGYYDEWPIGIWVEPLIFRGSKNGDGTAGYKNDGWGVSGGWERRLGGMYLGLSGSWISGSVDTGDYQSTDVSKYEVAGHWRMQNGNFNAFARAGYYWAKMDFSGTFNGAIDGDEFSYGSASDWSGKGYTALAGASYGFDVSTSLSLRPKVVLEYYQLDEKGYETSADTDALALYVEGRSSDRTTVTPSMILGYRLENEPASHHPLTIEFEAGYQSILSGGLGSVTANFEDGESFTIEPSDMSGGWTTEARIRSGAWDGAWQIAVGAQQTDGDVDLSARISINVAF
ncbi:autotransporter outer membrane beta-barrel domain-containing protein [Croceicoccus bisphenolivorans]|uniref:autotransporter family protein n=1 Tax=Croceicoccus bisphenolivorans TaxID=1783232 RepID=UPI0008354942|nr:autotransporter outer membrane beta-barrel domain-containing protein [Croceicoccus bisphenolivorans]